MASQNHVSKLYRTVVDDVISNVREAFLDECVDEQVLQELKQLWDSKLMQSKAIDNVQAEHEKLVIAYQQQQQQQQQQAQQQASIQQAVATPVASTSQKTVTQTVTVTQPSAIPSIQFNPGHMPIELSSAAQAAAGALPLTVYQQTLANSTGTIKLQTGNNAAQFIVSQGGGLFMATQQQINDAQFAAAQAAPQGPLQIDGTNDSSSDDDDDKDDDDDDDDENDENDENNECAGEEEEPLNSDDDVSDQDPSDLFDTDNVVVCQYDKINRNKNKWKFHLKDGIMNLNGKDFVFQKATGEADW